MDSPKGDYTSREGRVFFTSKKSKSWKWIPPKGRPHRQKELILILLYIRHRALRHSMACCFSLQVLLAGFPTGSPLCQILWLRYRERWESLSSGGACRMVASGDPCSMRMALCSMRMPHYNTLFTHYYVQFSYYSGANVVKHISRS